jgi:hypothetical protein
MARVRARATARRAAALAACAVASASVAALAFAPAPAAAVIVSIESGRTVSLTPVRSAQPKAFDAFFSNLDYNGGPVMPSNTNYTVYWRPSGAPAYPSDYQGGVNRFFEDLAHDSGGQQNVDSVATQYNDSAGEFAHYDSRWGGALIDTDPYPASGCKQATICLTDAQLRTELTSFVKAQGLPTDLSHEYFLLTPPGVEDCFTAGGAECSAGSKKPTYCAYHGDIHVTGGVLVYSNDPYVTENFGCDDGNHPNGTTSDGVLEGGLSHEHNESITDPEPNNAWTDIGGSGGENGDKCRTFVNASEYGPPLGKAGNGASYNQLINGHPYWYQQEWSNQGAECLQRFTFSGVAPTATFTSTPGAGNAVTLDASGSTAPGGVARYSWQFNDGPGLSAPVETTAPTVNHSFPAAGTYLVALTVFAGDGTSIGTARSVTAGGGTAVPSITKIGPIKGPVGGGTKVTITGANFTGATLVRFGTESASYTVVSSTKIVAYAPAHAAGTVDVTVTTPAGQSALVTSDRFKYVPTVSAVSPASGPVAGGTLVTVTGTGFAVGTGTTIIKFGGAKSPSVTCATSTTCNAVSPKHLAGTVDVHATVNSATSVNARPGDQFTYA